MNLNINFGKKDKDLAFQGKRTDRNLVNSLAQEGGALNAPKRRAIKNTLKKLAQDGSSNNIKFLLDVAQNLKYGIKEDSKIDNFLKEKSSIADKKQFQNNEWESLLKQTIEKALDLNKTQEKESLQGLFDKAFANKEDAKEKIQVSANEWLAVNTSVDDEKALIGLRNNILNSESFKVTPERASAEKFEANKKTANKMIDYFMASSEVSLSEKKECLKLLDHFMSSDYTLNSQLEGRKVQVLQEVLSDIVTEIPEQKMLVAKGSNQRRHGMCAAISIVRKVLPHEHKLAYVSAVLSELNNKPTIEVYDVLSKDFSEKVNVKKADVDYSKADSMGYRIVDAAVTNWMHIADTTGVGNTSAQWFKPFDKENYGMLHDAHLVHDLEGENKPKHYILRATTKIIPLVKSALKTIKENKELHANYNQIQNEYVKVSSQVRKDVASVLSNLTSDENQIKELTTKVLSPKYTDIKGLETINLQLRKIAAFLNTELKNVPESKLMESAKLIHNSFAHLNDALVQKQKLNRPPSKMADYNQNLFKIAAFYRVKTENELDVPEYLEQKAKQLNVEANKEAVLKKMETLGLIADRVTLDKLQEKFDDLLLFSDKLMKAKEKGETLKDPNIYKFTKEQKGLFDKVEKSLLKIQRETKRQYTNLNTELKEDLAEMYDKQKYKGALWAGEEGSSGLNSYGQTRILEQTTGKDFSIVDDITKALDIAESGKGSGIVSSSMSTKSPAFHAQYMQDVDYVEAYDHNTGEIKKQRALFQDNTWGGREFQNIWMDEAENLRSDYGRGGGTELGNNDGFGGKYGFLIRTNYTEGVTEQEYKEGILSDEKRGEMPMLMKFIMPGTLPVAGQEAASLASDIFSIKTRKKAQVLQEFLNALIQTDLKLIQESVNTAQSKILPAVHQYIQTKDKQTLQITVSSAMNEALKSATKENFNNTTAQKLSEAVFKEVFMLANEAVNAKSSDTIKQVETLKAVESKLIEVISKNIDTFKTISKGKVENLSKNAKVIDEKVAFRKKEVFEALKDKKGVFAKINSQEDMDALSNDNKIKFLLEKAVLQNLANTITGKAAIEVKDTKNFEELNSTKEILLTEQKAKLKILLGKEPKVDKEVEEKLTPEQLKAKKKLDEIRKSLIKEPTTVEELRSSEGGEVVINWIDAKFDPKDNNEFMKIYKFLKNTNEKNLDVHLNSSTSEQLGIKPETSYSLLQRLRGMESTAQTSLTDSIFAEEYMNKYGSFKSKGENMELVLRYLKNILSYTTVGSSIGGFKDQAFKDYKVRSNHPDLKIMSDEDLEKETTTLLNKIKGILITGDSIRTQIEKTTGAEQESLKEDLKSQKAYENHALTVFLDATVQPKHHNKIRQNLNQWKKEYLESPDSDKTKSLEKSLVKIVSQKASIKDPESLLESLMDDVLNGDKFDSVTTRNEVIAAKMSKLILCLSAADKTALEFKLAKILSDGNIPQITRAFKEDMNGYIKSGKHASWNSKEGVNEIFQALEDPANDNSTLKMFVKTLGMTEFAAKTFLDGVSFEKIMKHIKLTESRVNKIVEDKATIQNIYSEWLENSGLSDDVLNVMDVEATEKVMNSLLEKVAEHFEQNNDIENKSFRSYAGIMGEKMKVAQMSSPVASAIDTVKAWNEEIGSSRDDVENFIEKIHIHIKNIEKNKNGVKVLQDIADSELKEKIDNYILGAKETSEKLFDLAEVYQNPIINEVIAETKKVRAEKLKAAGSTKEAEKVDSVEKEESQESLEEIADKQIDLLLRSFLIDDQDGQRSVVKGMIDKNNPILDQKLVKFLNDEKANDVVKTYATGILLQKGKFKEVVEYADKMLFNEIPYNESITFGVDAMIVAAKLAETDEDAQPYLASLEKAYKLAFDPKVKNPYADKLINKFIRETAGNSPRIDKLLLKMVTSKENHSDVKNIALQALSSTNHVAYFPLVEDIAKNMDNYAKDDFEKLYMFDAVSNIILRTKKVVPCIDVSTLDSLKQIDLDSIAKNALKSEQAKEVKLSEKEATIMINTIRDRIKELEELI